MIGQTERGYGSNVPVDIETDHPIVTGRINQLQLEFVSLLTLCSMTHFYSHQNIVHAWVKGGQNHFETLDNPWCLEEHIK